MEEMREERKSKMEGEDDDKRTKWGGSEASGMARGSKREEKEVGGGVLRIVDFVTTARRRSVRPTWKEFAEIERTMPRKSFWTKWKGVAATL